MVKKNNFKILSYFFLPLLITLAFKYVSSKPAIDDISISSQTDEIVKTTSKIELTEVDFNFDVKPILSDKCYTCHGPDDKARKANLRLDIESGFYKSLEDNPNHYVINKNSPEKSEILNRINSENASYVMPPPESNLKLSVREKEVLKKWVDQGGNWEPHWAYTKPKLPNVPEIDIENWASNEIDYFIAKKLKSVGMTPSEKEEKEILIRRAYFDLIGLPPTIQEIDEFVSDNSNNAYEKVIDKLLESKSYGGASNNYFEFKLFDKAQKSKFSYNGKLNFRPFHSYLMGSATTIDFSHLFSDDAIIKQLLKTEILNNKNIDFKLNVSANKIRNLDSFTNIFLNLKIQEGLIDLDQTKFSWKNHANFVLADSLIYVKNGKLVLDANSEIKLINLDEIYKYLVTPKNLRKKMNKMNINFTYLFDEKTLYINDIKVDGIADENLLKNLNEINLKENSLQNKIYFKNFLNDAIKNYAG